ncbi:MAG: 30S ribosomal protein S2 [Patescibacteria group bacterium]
MTKIPSLEEMLAAGMHFGHSTSKWHPKMKPYIFTSKKGVNIIDLTKTSQMLEEALEFMKNLTAEKKLILFVGTKKQVKHPMEETAKETGMPYICEKWPGGAITNFSILKRSIKKYQDLAKEREQGKLAKYTKKEQVEFEKEIGKLETKVKGLVNLNKLPDALFVWDIKKERIAVSEARKKNIPIIAICDTNTNPSLVNYPIPANDDATKTVELVLDMVKQAIQEGKRSSSDPK